MGSTPQRWAITFEKDSTLVQQVTRYRLHILIDNIAKDDQVEGNLRWKIYVGRFIVC